MWSEHALPVPPCAAPRHNHVCMESVAVCVCVCARGRDW